MAGLRKQKEYDWKDSNLAMFGSDTERQVKKDSAMTEKAWKNAGSKVGLQIWRIVKFQVTHWPKEDYGKFYNGDSYIILNTYKDDEGEQLLFDVHFWIGKHSSQDEYGTAAYKTVELDTLLDDVPVQHREVQGHESELFMSYFKTIEILEGGAESGFRHVKPEEYTPRLLHFHGEKKNISVKQVNRCVASLDSGDVFILDLGMKLIQWNGSGSNKDERFKAGQYMQQLEQERSGKPKKEFVEEGQDTEEFDSYLTESKSEEEVFEAVDETKELYRLSDASGKMQFSLEKKGQMTKSTLDSKDVFILDTKKSLYVWIGKKTSVNEKRNAMAYAHQYLQRTDHPLVSVSCIAEGAKTNTNKLFEAAIAA